MSLRITASQLLAIARSQRGVTESPSNSNRQRYGVAYGLNAVPWCALFVWFCFKQLGVDLRTMISSKLEWTPTFAAECARAGWPRIAPDAARAGDIVFFRFGSQIDHVGICTNDAPGGRIDTIDGNTSTKSENNGGAVLERSRSTSLVAAVYRPPYAATATPAPPGARPILRRTLRTRSRWLPMMRGNDVRLVQRLVGVRVVDGAYGPKTAAAVAVWQHKQRIAQDGEFGPASARAAGWAYKA